MRTVQFAIQVPKRITKKKFITIFVLAFSLFILSEGRLFRGTINIKGFRHVETTARIVRWKEGGSVLCFDRDRSDFEAHYLSGDHIDRRAKNPKMKLELGCRLAGNTVGVHVGSSSKHKYRRMEVAGKTEMPKRKRLNSIENYMLTEA